MNTKGWMIFSLIFGALTVVNAGLGFLSDDAASASNYFLIIQYAMRGLLGLGLLIDFGGNMSQEYESFIHRWFEEVWNYRSERAIDEMFAEDGVANGLTDAEGNPLRGPEGFKQLHRTFLAAYPDLRITVEDIVSDGDKIAARCKVTGTHAGDGLGIAPTNQPVEFTGITIVRVKDDKIVEAWNEFDFMKMYSQLGAVTLNLQ
jgi:predicted ester cyclase